MTDMAIPRTVQRVSPATARGYSCILPPLLAQSPFDQSAVDLLDRPSLGQNYTFIHLEHRFGRCCLIGG